jgi:hypothetical protein
MGGARKERRKEPEENPQKHPALVQKSSKSPVTPVSVILAMNYFGGSIMLHFV